MDDALRRAVETERDSAFEAYRNEHSPERPQKIQGRGVDGSPQGENYNVGIAAAGSINPPGQAQSKQETYSDPYDLRSEDFR
jgi:hypothetical protein